MGIGLLKVQLENVHVGERNATKVLGGLCDGQIFGTCSIVKSDCDLHEFLPAIRNPNIFPLMTRLGNTPAIF